MERQTLNFLTETIKPLGSVTETTSTKPFIEVDLSRHADPNSSAGFDAAEGGVGGGARKPVHSSPDHKGGHINFVHAFQAKHQPRMNIAVPGKSEFELTGDYPSVPKASPTILYSNTRKEDGLTELLPFEVQLGDTPETGMRLGDLEGVMVLVHNKAGTSHKVFFTPDRGAKEAAIKTNHGIKYTSSQHWYTRDSLQDAKLKRMASGVSEELKLNADKIFSVIDKYMHDIENIARDNGLKAQQAAEEQEDQYKSIPIGRWHRKIFMSLAANGPSRKTSIQWTGDAKGSGIDAFAFTSGLGDIHMPDNMDVPLRMANPDDIPRYQNARKDAFSAGVDSKSFMFGVVDTSVGKHYVGVKLFDARTRRLSPGIVAYMQEKSKIIAEASGKSPKEDEINRLREQWVNRVTTKLLSAAETTDGFVSLKQLSDAEGFEPTHPWAHMTLSPEISYYFKSMLNHVDEAGLKTDSQELIKDLRKQFEEDWKYSSDKLIDAQKAHAKTEQVASVEKRSMRDKIRDQLATIVFAHSNTMYDSVNKDSAADVTMPGWQRITVLPKSFNDKEKYIYIPPVAREFAEKEMAKLAEAKKRDNTIGSITLDTGEKGGYSVSGAASFLAQRSIRPEVTIMDKDGVRHDINEAVTAAKSWLDNARTFSSKFDYGFDKKHIRAAEDSFARGTTSLQTTLNSMDSMTDVRRKQVNERIMSIANHLFSQENQATMGRVLSGLGEIQVTEGYNNSYHVLFAPTGDLFRVLDNGELRPVPMYAFSKKSLYGRVLKALHDYSRNGRIDPEFRISAQNELPYLTSSNVVLSRLAGDYQQWYRELQNRISKVDDFAVGGSFNYLEGVALASSTIPGARIKTPSGYHMKDTSADELAALTRESKNNAMEFLRRRAKADEIVLNDFIAKNAGKLTPEMISELREHARVMRGTTHDSRIAEDINHMRQLDALCQEDFNAAAKQTGLLQIYQDSIRGNTGAEGWLDNATGKAVSFIEDAWKRFSGRIFAIFDALFNPQKIAMHLGESFLEAAWHAAKTFFSVFFSSFQEKHFGGDDLRVARAVMDDAAKIVGIKPMTVHELNLQRKIMAGGYAKTEAHERKNRALNDAIRVEQNWESLRGANNTIAQSFVTAWGAPELRVPEGKTSIRRNDNRVELVYTLKDANAAALTGYHEGMGVQDKANWWRKNGGLFLPEIIAPYNSAPTAKWQSRRNELRQTDKFLDYIKFDKDANEIRIQLTVEDLGLKTEDVYRHYSETGFRRKGPRSGRVANKIMDQMDNYDELR